MAVYLSAVLAFGMHPIVRWIERLPLLRHGRRHVPRWLAILVIYAGILAIVVGHSRDRPAAVHRPGAGVVGQAAGVR